jgi:hypothetical protein
LQLRLLVSQQTRLLLAKKSALAYRLLVQTTVRQDQAQLALVHPLLIIKATLGPWFRKAHVKPQ